MKIIPLGDSALLLRVADSPKNHSLGRVLALAQNLERCQLPHVLEIAPAYDTIGIFYDAPALVRSGTSLESLFVGIEQAVAESSGAEIPAARLIEILVCYDAEFAIDLDVVAKQTGIDAEKIPRLHAAADYQVACLGFAPGFPYLIGLPTTLTTPRRATPRAEVAAGSVAIGGAQTGIYPRESPGGWNIIGRTPLRLFDSQRNPPALLRAGDRVKFRAITRAEFEQFAE